MIVTIPFIYTKFEAFNSLIFEGKLPTPTIKLSRARTFLGKCVIRKPRFAFGRITGKCVCTLRFSVNFDLPENEWEDIIIHEMIHLYIGAHGDRDTSAHGVLFRRCMNDINSRFGRHITVSHRMSSEEREKNLDTRRRPHVVAVVCFADGRVGFKVLSRSAVRIQTYCRGMISLTGEHQVSSIQLYMSYDPYFNRYPASSAMYVFFPKNESILKGHLADAERLRNLEP